MQRTLILLYGLIAYACFLVTFLYAIGFVGNLLVPKSIDSGAEGPIGLAILVNVALLGLFGVQHSIMARPEFKARWTKIIPKAAERSTFVLLTCIILGLTYWQWRPITSVVWDVEAPALRTALIGLSWLGWLIVLYATFLIDHFDLFGVRQVILHYRGILYTHRPFAERSLYRLVRHPLMLGFLVAFWATPTMTMGHLLFAGVVTAYVLVALQLEERDLVRQLGDDYVRYQQRTSMILPLPKRPAADPAPVGNES
jgi:protein-S-isoprenylcysteine O-methyltransferase Ste14